MKILNKIMARGRHSLVLEVEMDHFRYCTDNFLGAESVVSSPGRDSRDLRSSRLAEATQKALGTNAL